MVNLLCHILIVTPMRKESLNSYFIYSKKIEEELLFLSKLKSPQSSRDLKDMI